MNLLKKIVIVYLVISIFSGCAYFIDKLKPGFMNDIAENQKSNIAEYSENDKDTRFFDHQPEPIEHEPSIITDYSQKNLVQEKTEPQNPEQINNTVFSDHKNSYDPSEIIYDEPEVEAGKHEFTDNNVQEDESNCLLDDSDCIVEDYPFSESEDYTSYESIPIERVGKKNGPNKKVEIKQRPLVCTGESVSKHWHDLNQVIVIVNFLNIRSNYGGNQPVIGTATKCEKLKVIDKHIERVRGSKKIRSRGWLKILTQGGVTGWVAGWHTRHIED